MHVNNHHLHHPAARPERADESRTVWLGFIVVLAAAVMDLLDSTIAQTAAPAIRRELGGSYTQLEWISAAYTLAMSVTLLRSATAARMPSQPNGYSRSNVQHTPSGMLARQTPWNPSQPAITSHSSSCASPSWR